MPLILNRLRQNSGRKHRKSGKDGLGAVTSLNNLALAVSAGFKLANNTCTATLVARANCTVGVVFAPTGAGAQTGSLTVTSSTAPAAATVALAGTGFDFTVTAMGSISQTVVNGQTANYSLVITPLGGAQGSYTFACGTLPSHAFCTFAPPSETIAGAATGTLAVAISTGLATAQLTVPRSWSVLPLLCGLVVLPWARRRKALGLIALLAILAGSLASCSASGGGTTTGPGGGSGSSSGSTPAGSYAIPLTVSSDGVQHSFTLTLIVE